MLEHVVALKWLAAEGNRVVDPMIRELANQADRRRQAMEAASWTGGNHSAFAEAIADGAAATDDVSQDTYLKFKHRCDTYGHPDEGSSWLIETAHSHPGMGNRCAVPERRQATPAAARTGGAGS